MSVSWAGPPDSARASGEDVVSQSALAVLAAESDYGIPVSGHYRIGEAILEVQAHAAELLAPVDRLYGACALAPTAVPEPPQVRCVVRRLARASMALLTFREGAPPDPAAVALALLHPPAGAPRYGIVDAPLAGWRGVGDAMEPIVMVSAARVLIDHERVPEDFIAEYMVSATLAGQADLVVLHGAALHLGRNGVLLAGPSRAGKTTTSIHLAARGHALLGDELAVVKMKTFEVLPLRRSVSLRSGPRSPGLAAVFARRKVDGAAPFRIDEMFPGAAATAAPLRAAFFLSGFADHARVARFEPTLDDTAVFDHLAASDVATVSWGLTPARRALRLLALNQMLRRVPSWRLTVGSPDETAELIERTVEAQKC